MHRGYSFFWFHTLKDDPDAPFCKVTPSYVCLNLFIDLFIPKAGPQLKGVVGENGVAKQISPE